MDQKLVICEKPLVAQSIAKVIGARNRHEGYLDGNGWVVSWCVGHLVELEEPEAYDRHYKKWDKNDLPIVPKIWKYRVTDAIKKQFDVLKKLMNREDVGSLVCATDAGREEGADQRCRSGCYYLLRKFSGLSISTLKVALLIYTMKWLCPRNCAKPIRTMTVPSCRHMVSP